MTIELHQGGRGLTRATDAIEPRSFEDTWRLAQILAKTRMFGLTTPEDAFVVLATGIELGVPAMTAPRGIYVIDGKPSLYAQMMVALVRASGKCETWRILERTTTRCVIETKRAGVHEQPVTFTWTIERARGIFIDKDRKTPLTSKPVWQNDPEGMLYNRCSSEACRVQYSDVTLNLYTPEELETRTFDGVAEIVETRRAVVTVADVQPTPAPATPVTVVPPVVAPTPSDDIEVWRARFAAAVSLAEVAEIAKACPRPLQKALKEDYAAAKSRLDPKPPTGGGAPKPEAPATTDATGSGEHTQAQTDDPSAAILAEWRDHLAAMTTPQHVIHSVAAHLEEFPEPLRARVIDAAAARARAFKWAETNDVDGAIREAIAAKRAA